MDIDQALQVANPLGRTQMLIVAASVLMNMETVMLTLSQVFLAEVPPHHCNYNSTNRLNESIPIQGSDVAKCKEFVNPLYTNETHECTNGWVYNTEVTGQSIVSEWDLVCDKDFLPGLSQSLLLTGFALGSVVAGPLADTYGRRPNIIIALLMFNAIGIAVSFVQSFVVFTTLRVLMGGIFKAVRMPLINLLYEFLPPKHRPIIGLIPNITAVLGYVFMTGFGYYVRDWRYFHLLIISPCVLLMTFSWFIPESVRWIISQGDKEKAEMAMQKVAKFNKAVDFPNPVFSSNRVMDAGNLDDICSKPEEGGKSSKSADYKRKGQTGLRAVIQLFKQPVLTVTLVLSLDWLAATLIFFGFSLSTGRFAGNPYLNFLIIAVADSPARILGIFLIKKMGNLKPLVFGLLGAGVTLIVNAVLPYLVEDDSNIGTVLTALAVLGKFSLGFAIPAVNLYIGELFPTTMRNSGMAVVHLIGNIGSLSSPILLYFDKYFNRISFIIMAVFAFSAATVSLLLPDTRNTIQPETPADLQAILDQRRRLQFGKIKKNTPQNVTTEDGKVELKGFDKATDF